MIKKLLSIFNRYFLFFKDVYFDTFYYFRYSTLRARKKNNENLSARILAHVHSIERAFSLKNTRKVFGKDLVNNLKQLIADIDCKDRYEFETRVYKSAINGHNMHHGLLEDFYHTNWAPIKRYKHLFFNRKSSYIEVVKSRRSIRNFSKKRVMETSLLQAIALAKDTSPSVCNRQAWKVFILKNRKIIEQVLEIQNGNSGIENIQNIIIVCSTITSFFDSSERNQPYIDGGIFLMSLLNSLHYKNIASCPLNWSVNKSKDFALKRILNIDNSIIIVSLIAIGGYGKDQVNVASSYRKPLKKILNIIH